jgi:hypothetical protein
VTITALADSRFGRPDITFDSTGGPPPPLDQVINWLFSTICDITLRSLNRIVSDQLAIRIVHIAEDNGLIRLRFVDNRFFAKEAVVLLGHLWSRSWE